MHARNTILVILCLMVIQLVGCDLTYPEEKPIRLSLELTSQKIQKYEKMEVEFKVTNITVNEINYRFSNGCQYGYILQKGRDILYNSVKHTVCTGAVSHLRLNPGEHKTYTVDFRIDKEFEPGVYTVAAFLRQGYSDSVVREFLVIEPSKN